MTTHRYYVNGQTQSMRLAPLSSLDAGGPGALDASSNAGRPPGNLLRGQGERFTARFRDLDAEPRAARYRETTVVATESIVVEDATRDILRRLRDDHGFELAQEGREDKVLLLAPPDVDDRVQAAFDVARRATERGLCSAHPNFLRVIPRSRPAAPANGSTRAIPWNLKNNGTIGIAGADCHAEAAWTITRGDRRVRVAVLDEGVDTDHPWLRSVVVAEADFVDDNPHARPDGDDAHGTACAGIICSQQATTPGLASRCSLVAVRIAKDDGAGNWIFDDFDTADAIDWAWKEAKSWVLSNSWGGGPPVDGITHAFERARTRGRGGLGAVIVIAAGNSEGPILYPGTLDDVCTVGASNQWDERKTRNSRDNEHWWGSCHGPALDLLAPGVQIRTPDIQGARGYSDGLYTSSFNGTSSATPHVAATAALILSVRPDLPEADVRAIINATADSLQRQWSSTHGHGRLNAYRALWAARRA